jgi:hypothetical protein
MQQAAETWVQVSVNALEAGTFYQGFTASVPLGVVVLACRNPHQGLAIVQLRDLDPEAPGAVPVRRMCRGTFSAGDHGNMQVAFLQQDPRNMLAVAVDCPRGVGLLLVDVVTGTVEEKAWELPRAYTLAMAAGPGRLAVKVDNDLFILRVEGLVLRAIQQIRCHAGVCTSLGWLGGSLLDLHMRLPDDWQNYREDGSNEDWVLARHTGPTFAPPDDWQTPRLVAESPAVDDLLRTADVSLVVADGSVFALAGPTLLHVVPVGKWGMVVDARPACEMPTDGATYLFEQATFVPGHGMLVLVQTDNGHTLRKLMRQTMSAARTTWLAACVRGRGSHSQSDAVGQGAFPVVEPARVLTDDHRAPGAGLA